jgi:hypothetical protein
MSLIYLAGGVLFFGLSIGFVQFAESLRRDS